MSEQIKAPMRIKIVAGLMFIGGLFVLLLMGVIPIIAIIKNVHFYHIESIMYERKSPTVVDLLRETLVQGRDYIWSWEIGYAIMSLLSIIAAIGLWKMKKWGLFVSYFALSVSISITTIQAIIILILKEVPGVIGVDYLSEIISWYVPPIFIAISILYCLWRKRRCFS